MKSMLAAAGLIFSAFAVVACGSGELGFGGLRAGDKEAKLELEPQAVATSFGTIGAGPMQGVACAETVADIKRRLAHAGATGVELSCSVSRFGGFRVHLTNGMTPNFVTYIGGNSLVTYATVDACVAALPAFVADVEKERDASVLIAFCNNLPVASGENPYRIYYGGGSNTPVTAPVGE